MIIYSGTTTNEASSHTTLQYLGCSVHDFPHSPAGHPRLEQPTTTASPPGLEGATHVVVVESNLSPPYGKINAHDQFLSL